MAWELGKRPFALDPDFKDEIEVQRMAELQVYIDAREQELLKKKEEQNVKS
jgi:hypothetical protein